MGANLTRGAQERASKLLRLVLSDSEWDWYERTKGVRFTALFYGKTCLVHCSPEWCGVYVLDDGRVQEKRYIYPAGREYEMRKFCFEDRVITYMLWEELAAGTLCNTGCASAPMPEEANRILAREPHRTDVNPWPY